MRYLAIICYVALRCSFFLVFTIQVDKIDLNWCVSVCMCYSAQLASFIAFNLAIVFTRLFTYLHRSSENNKL